MFGLALLGLLPSGFVLAQLPAAAPAQPSTAIPTPLVPAQRNPVELQAPQPAVRLAPPLEGAPLRPQTGPGAAAQVTIGRVTVIGNAAVPEARLRGAVDRLEGASVPLSRIEEARLGILRGYRDAGFPFAAVNAGLTRRPDGTADLSFAVVEGSVAEVRLEGDVGPAGTRSC